MTRFANGIALHGWGVADPRAGTDTSPGPVTAAQPSTARRLARTAR